MNTGFSLFCDEEKKQSLSPRRVFKAKRRGDPDCGSNASFNIHEEQQDVFTNDRDVQFTQMTDEQYMEYQQDTMTKRMSRKRNFGIFSSGSNLTLFEILQSAQTFRIPHYALFYVRVDAEPNTNTMNPESNRPQIPKTHSNDAFQLMMNRKIDTSSNHESKCEETQDLDTEMMDTDATENIIYPEKRECLITSCVRVLFEWVPAYDSFTIADNINWKRMNPNSKIHEYQISHMHGITLLNLDKTDKKLDSTTFANSQQNIKQWVLDHNYSGFIMNGCFHFYQPHLYWHLLDDNKESKMKQALISDMFQSNKSKPKYQLLKQTSSQTLFR